VAAAADQARTQTAAHAVNHFRFMMNYSLSLSKAPSILKASPRLVNPAGLPYNSVLVKFSIVIAAYNVGRFVAEAVASALDQEGAEKEVIVVDDGSTDDTPQALEKLAGRIRLIRQENRGVSAARNRGIREAQTEWIAFLDGDDLFLPGHLARAGQAVAEHPEAVMFYADVEARDESLRFLKVLRSRRDPAAAKERLLLNNFICSNSVVARREALLACGGFPEDLRHAGEDWELWVRLAHQGPIFHAGHVAGIYRWHPQSKIRSPGPELRDDNLRALARLSRDLALDPALAQRAQARIYMESGVRYLVAGERSRSREEFRQARRLEPALLPALFGEGLSLLPAPVILWLRRLRGAA